MNAGEGTVPVVIIAGPTASGKSAAAVRLAEETRGIVINADSLQLYRELEILSNRPSPADMARAPHRLFGSLSAREPCSAGRYRRLAWAEIAAARRENRLPILAGGTGLYIKAVMEGLAPVPEVDAQARREAVLLLERIGEEAFRAELARRDPQAAARIKKGDRQRLVRAFEVLHATGRPLSEWRRMPAEPGASARFAVILFDPPRQALYEACERRFEAMMARGALDEAERIAAEGLPATSPVAKAVGVRELVACLRGELGLEAAVAKAKQSTRNYAKRQVTWFRHQLQGGLRLPAAYSEELAAGILAFVRSALLTPGGPKD